jgi:hypothetical protein
MYLEIKITILEFIVHPHQVIRAKLYLIMQFLPVANLMMIALPGV